MSKPIGSVRRVNCSDWLGLGEVRASKCTNVHGFRCTPNYFVYLNSIYNFKVDQPGSSNDGEPEMAGGPGPQGRVFGFGGPGNLVQLIFCVLPSLQSTLALHKDVKLIVVVLTK